VELTSALVLFMPPEVQAFAAPLMRQHAPDSLIRVPPHITVLYPFAPPDELPSALDTVRQICARVPPFLVTLDGYGSFPTVAYLKPANPAPIQALFREIFWKFPQYPPYRGEFGDQLTLHVTVGTFESAAAREAVALPAYPPFTFTAHRLHAVVGRDGVPVPWITEAVIPFGG
jgi:2'-5' RNA ligase